MECVGGLPALVLFEMDIFCFVSGGDTGSLYPHLYNNYSTLLTQLGTKHSRLSVHVQNQSQVIGYETTIQFFSGSNAEQTQRYYVI